jgi:DNA-binding CsgD family transcriptional regulator
MTAMRAGGLEFYRAHGVFEGTGVPGGAIAAWVRAIELGGHRYAFVTLSASDADGNVDDEAITRDLVLRTVAIGIADPDFRVRYASVEASNALGLTVDDLLGTRLAESDRRGQLAVISAAERRPIAGISFAFPARVKNHDGEATSLICVVTSLAGSPDRLFMLVRPPEEPATASRLSELEHHLWRIAAEVEASGILLQIGSLPAAAMALHPQAAALSPRQWEILQRLMGGQRVPTIARELFISQSTVRNHLSIIFDRFDVRSQPELLRLLAGEDLASA